MKEFFRKSTVGKDFRIALWGTINRNKWNTFSQPLEKIDYIQRKSGRIGKINPAMDKIEVEL